MIYSRKGANWIEFAVILPQNYESDPFLQAKHSHKKKNRKREQNASTKKKSLTVDMTNYLVLIIKIVDNKIVCNLKKYIILELESD